LKKNTKDPLFLHFDGRIKGLPQKATGPFSHSAVPRCRRPVAEGDQSFNSVKPKVWLSSAISFHAVGRKGHEVAEDSFLLFARNATAFRCLLSAAIFLSYFPPTIPILSMLQ
jgi:hypothetical protein